MGTNLRILGAGHLGFRLALVATSESTSFPASNLETGNRQRFWHTTSTAEQALAYETAAGQTESCDTVALPRADLLVAVGASVAVQYSTSPIASSSWTDAFTPLTPIQSSDLVAPTGTDYVREFAGQSRRSWRLRLYGSLTGGPSLAGGWFLGLRTELPTNPQWGRELGIARPHRGLELAGTWPPMSPSEATAFLTAMAAVTPDAAESPHETVSGVVYGGLPHYLYDPDGVVFRQSGTPYLVPVLCLTPEGVVSQSLAPTLEGGPTLRWRERR